MGEIILNYPGGPDLVTQVLESGETSPAVVRDWLQKNGQRDARLLALKMEKGGHKPRNVAASRSWRDKETDTPLETSRKEHSLADIVRPISDF